MPHGKVMVFDKKIYFETNCSLRRKLGWFYLIRETKCDNQ